MLPRPQHSLFVEVQDGELEYRATLRVTSMLCSPEMAVEGLCLCTGGGQATLSFIRSFFSLSV